MMILPAYDDRGIVVFKIAPSMPYGPRLIVSFGLVVAGFVVQLLTASFLGGAVLLLLGNLLLLVQGYDNRVDFGRFKPDAEWRREDIGKLAELDRLDQNIRMWDISALDVTNALGAAVFVILAGALVLCAVRTGGFLQILALDALVLLTPHWVTGIRSILVRPTLMIKVRALREVLDAAKSNLTDHQVHLLTQLSGAQAKVPQDLKVKIEIRGQSPDFLGVYGQVVLNQVQGRGYPYFYCVLVARQGAGLQTTFDAYQPSAGIVKEFKRQDQVEVLVIRQKTTRTSGYHTKTPAALLILKDALRLASPPAATA